MNFQIFKTFALLVFIFVSSGSFAQYKYDIGLRASSYDMERFQLEQRLHLDASNSIILTLATGSRRVGYYAQTGYYNDNLFDISNSQYRATNNALKLGYQRKLGFLASDVFYAGATIGLGFEEQRSDYYSVTYSVNDTMPSDPPYYYQWDEISSNRILTTSTAINAQFGVSFGMDVPITKRLSVNAEIGCAAIYTKSITYAYSFIDLLPSFSGGLRYQFGKRDSARYR